MSKILVKQLGGGVIGTIQVQGDGSWTLEAQSPEITNALRELVRQITVQPIPFITGREERDAHGTRFVTIRKMCDKGDPDYVPALADALHKHTLLGKRIRGTVERE